MKKTCGSIDKDLLFSLGISINELKRNLMGLFMVVQLKLESVRCKESVC